MEFTPGGASRTPQTVIDLNGASTLNDFGFYDSGNYDVNAAMTHPNISGRSIKTFVFWATQSLRSMN
ncbi:unnamed protein product [Strongylus vulgaris]|uniref:Uncharacterized protein n=1 Tax=Strongylus vulgaris TaxID=40348 RepID=A0A3P7LTB3_STRVU|nr:unnamed protein product [Strongylus vulgaris]